MKRYRPLLLALACLLAGLFAGKAMGAVVPRDAPAGSKIEVPGLGTRTLNAGDDITVRLPGDDVRVVVPPVNSTQPSTQPTTNPVPPDPSVPEQPRPGQAVRVVTNGTGTINASSGTFYTSPAGTRATVRGTDGITFGDNVQDVTFYRLDFVATSSSGKGVRMIARNVRRVRFVECSFSGFGAGATIQHPAMTKAPRSEYIRDVQYIRTRVMDMTDTADKGGHGLFLCGVAGFRFTESLVDGTGWQRKTGWVHGIYAKEGCTDVVVERSYFRRCASVGVQLRGPLIQDSARDDGRDPGPRVVDCLFDDCAIGIMLNGPRGHEEGNVIVTGHHHRYPDRNGQGGTYDSVGRLYSANNLLVSGPWLGAGAKFATWRNDDRPHKDKDAKGNLLKWEWTRPCVTTGGGNRADRGVVVDLSFYGNRARQRMDASVVREAQRAVRKAA